MKLGYWKNILNGYRNYYKLWLNYKDIDNDLGVKIFKEWVGIIGFEGECNKEV